MPSFRKTQALKARFGPDLREIGPLRERFVRFLESLRLQNQEIEGWKLIFTELLANAINHGAQGRKEAVLLAVWWSEGSSVFVETADPGEGPDPACAAEADLPEDPLSEGGRGLFLIRSFVDGWEHWRGPSGYRARVWKTYPDLPEVSPEDPSMELILDELADSYENLALYDQLGQAVAGGATFLDCYRSTVRLFLECGHAKHIHVETAPDSQLPELTAIARDTAFQRYGQARSSVWQALAKNPYLLWKDGDGQPSCFQNGREWHPEGCFVPIRHNETTVALLAVGQTSGGESLGSRQVRQIQAVANILGLALSRSIMDRERAERDRVRHEWRIATQLQQQLLPLDTAPPEVPGWQLFVRCDPAQEVAGDFAEIRPATRGTLVGCIIDVMGKGVTAAILAGIFRSHFLGFARTHTDPGAFLEHINESLERQLNRQTMFITAIVFRLDPASGSIRLASAGHPPVIVLRANGRHEEIGALNPPIGLFRGHQFEAQNLALDPGDRCLFVTDGLFEWTRPDGEMFGWEALVDWLKARAKQSPAELIKEFHSLSRASGNPANRDDETLVVLTRLTPSL
ncbi:MAG: SpoIIE family protein phosphatase [Opitutales bacterium]|nr:SpoIIE family protein phosphatase [Opitutales bacterium]